MNLPRRFSTVLKSLAVCAALAGAGAGFAQEKKAEAPAVSNAATTESVIEKVEMYGVTVGQMMDYLKQKTDVSYVIVKEAREYRLPDVIVRNVTPRELMETIMLATQGEVRVAFRESGNGRGPLFAISLDPQGRERVGPVNKVRVYAFSGFKDRPPEEFVAHAEKVTLAYIVGEEASGRGKGPDLEIRKFTEGAMMFARGTSEQLELLDQIVSALGGTSMSDQGSSTSTPVAKSAR